MSTRRVRIEYEPVRDQRPWGEDNPKAHDMAALAESIDEHGFVDPLVKDETTGLTVSGNGRLTELVRRETNGEVPPEGIEVIEGVWHAPILRGLAFESREHAERYLLAANRIGERGGYDDRKLAALLVAHADARALRGTGFSEGDVESLLERIGAARAELATEPGSAFERLTDADYSGTPDLMPEHPEPAPVVVEDEDATPPELELIRTTTGELWTLGDHRLVVGDSYESETIARALGGEEPALWMTDPPYNVGRDMDADFYDTPKPGHTTKDGGTRKGTALSELARSEWDQDFDVDRWLKAATPHRPRNGTVYVFGSERTLPQVWAWITEQGSKSNHKWCVWYKPNPMPSLMKRHWTWAAELIAYGVWGAHTFNFPEEGHCPNVWTINKSQKNDIHPTQKPVAVPAKGIMHSSARGDIVLDMFGGSGSTLIACDQLGRRCRMVEKNPKYADRIIRRWEKHTGQTARREDGALFAELVERAA